MALGLVTCLVFAARAAAQDAPPEAGASETPDEVAESSDDERARGLFLAGQAAFERGELDEALGYFEGAYRLSPRPELLYNIGLAAERAGRRARALDAYRQYLEGSPDPAVARTVAHRIRDLEELEADDDAPSAVPWIIVGGSAAVAIAGGIFLALGLADIDDVEDAPLDSAWPDYESQYERAPIFTGLGLALIGAGAAGAALGVVLLVTSDDRSVALGPGTLRVRF